MQSGKESPPPPNTGDDAKGDASPASNAVGPENNKTQFSFTEDFICVSEFSEIVGPVPLFCIPENATGNFNLEKFVIRIMAVDYQNKTQDAGTFMEDTQVVISEASEDAHAYVHHFTLLDVFARGYVRPICMSYITRHPTKIMENFADILDRFLRISHIFKTGNQQVFLKDIEHRLADLYHTRGVLEQQEKERKEKQQQQQQMQEANATENGAAAPDGAPKEVPATEAFLFGGHSVLIAPTTSLVDDQIKEMASIRERLKETMLQKHHHWGVRSYSRSNSAANIHEVAKKNGAEKEADKKEEEDEGDEEEEDDEEDEDEDDGEEEKDKDIFVSEGEGEGDAELLAIPQEGVNGDKPKKQDVENALDAELRRTGQERLYPTPENLERMPSTDDINATAPTPNGELESSQDDVEAIINAGKHTDTDVAGICKEIGLNLEGYEPKIVMSLYKGRKYETKLRELDELCGENFASAMRKLTQLREHYARPSLILTLENEELGLLEPSSTLLTAGGTVLCNFNLNSYTHSSRSPAGHGSFRRKRSSSASQRPSDWADNSPMTSGGTSPDSSSYNSVEEGSPASDLNHRIWMSGEFSVELTDRLQDLGMGDTPHVMVCPPDPLDPILQNDYDQSPRRKPTHQKLNVECWAGSLWDYSETNPGKGMKELLKYSFAKHLVFSLLKGRPVVIYAQSANEEAVRKLVGACSLFVFTHRQGAIVHWRTTPLRMSDLAHIKLAGMTKSASIPKSVEKYISILDYEAGTALCPPYEQGTFIDKILGLKHRWPDESTHLAYIHCKLLEMSIQACLYYHICCISGSNIYGQGGEGAPAPVPSGGSSSAAVPSSGFLRTYSSFLYSNWQQPQQPPPAGSTAAPSSALPPKAGTVKAPRPRVPARRRLTEAAVNTQDIGKGADPGGGGAVGGSVGQPISQSAPGNRLSKKWHHSDGQLQHIMVPPGMPPSVRDQAKSAFCKQMNAKSHDMAIIEHFAEVVKEQQAMELHGPGEQVVPVIKLDYTPCKLFTKSSKPSPHRSKKAPKKLLQL